MSTAVKGWEVSVAGFGEWMDTTAEMGNLSVAGVGVGRRGTGRRVRSGASAWSCSYSHEQVAGISGGRQKTKRPLGPGTG